MGLISGLNSFLAFHNLSGDVLQCIVLFFLAMVGMELALEAGTKEFSKQFSGTSWASMVTLFQFGFCLLLPMILTRGQALQKFPKTISELIPYVLLSIVVTGATGLATMAVTYVSFPTKVVFKSAKLIPTMVVATIIHRKVYGIREYTSAALLCLGAAGYSYGSGSSSDQSNNWKGIVLLTICVICDALVPNLQKKLMSPAANNEIEKKQQQQQQQEQHQQPEQPEREQQQQQLPLTTTSTNTKNKTISSSSATTTTTCVSASELMLNVNAIGFVGLLLYMIIMGQFIPAYNTAISHPRLLVYLVLVGLCLSTAVLNYTRLIQSSGSVLAVSVATLRKVATVILSYIVFPKALLGIHVVSGFLVLAGIVLSSSNNKNKNNNYKSVGKLSTTTHKHIC